MRLLTNHSRRALLQSKLRTTTWSFAIASKPFHKVYGHTMGLINLNLRRVHNPINTGLKQL